MLVKPLISEKTLQEAARERYSFATKTAATKTEIKKVVEKLFGVNVIKVQTSIRPGKAYRSGKRMIFKQKSDWKKATVTVKKGQKIGLFEMPGSTNPLPTTEGQPKVTDKNDKKQLAKKEER